MQQAKMCFRFSWSQSRCSAGVPDRQEKTLVPEERGAGVTTVDELFLAGCYRVSVLWSRGWLRLRWLCACACFCVT